VGILVKKASEKNMEEQRESDVTPATTNPAKLKMGWLFKRNRHGFRNWKKRWFVLKGGELSWYSSHEDVFSGATWGTPHGKIMLKNNVLIRGSQGSRIQILHCDDLNNINDTRLANREVAALNEQDCVEWMQALEDHIDECNLAPSIMAKRQSTKPLESLMPSVEDEKQAPPTLARENSTFGGFSGVKDWLKSLGLAEYSKNFENIPALTMKVIEEVGLSDKDLDNLFIREEFARRLILNSCKGGFAPNLEVDVNGARDFGDVIVFRVVSHYRIRRSVVYLRFSDFVKLQAKFRQSLAGRDDLLKKMPSLPGKGIWESRTANRSKKFVSERQTNLALWLRELAEIVSQDEQQLRLLLGVLELNTFH